MLSQQIDVETVSSHMMKNVILIRKTNLPEEIESVIQSFVNLKNLSLKEQPLFLKPLLTSVSHK
jgi:hypothetical protein